MPAKLEYPPLFPAGFHPMTREELRQKCVDAFPLSSTRSEIARGLEQRVEMLENADISGEL
jgi:hypothetical protein